MWGTTLAAKGYVALMLDSFSARGVQQLCTIRFADRSIKEADRIGDAYAALVYLRQFYTTIMWMCLLHYSIKNNHLTAS